MPTLVETIDGGTVGCTWHTDGEDSHVVLVVTDHDQNTLRVHLLPEVAALLGKEIVNDAAETPLRPTD